MRVFIKDIIIAFLLFATISCNNNTNTYKTLNGGVWNTTYHIIYDSAVDLSDSITATLAEVDLSVSVFNAGSTLSKINNNESCRSDLHFKRLFEMSKHINKISGGFFDPTISPLIDAWGFGVKGEKISEDINTDSLLKFVGMDKINLIGDSIVKDDERISMNFSAIAKGYGCDEIGRMFDRNGIKNYLIEIGGEIAVKGYSDFNQKWTIAIDRPIENSYGQDREIQMIIELTDCGVATSGNYRNFHNVDNRHIAHTINPATGFPIQTDVASATIVSDNCAEADAYATACMVAGSERAKEIVKSANIEAMLILTDGNVWTSEGFKEIIIKQ